MQVRPNTDGPGLNAFKASQDKLGKLAGKMAQGKAITGAADNAAGLSMARELEKQVRAQSQGSRSVADGLAALRIADGAASSQGEMVQRQRELAIQASNGTLNADQRKSLDTEYQALTSELDRTAKQANYNNQGLLDGQSRLSDGTGSQNLGGARPDDTISWRQADTTAQSLGVEGRSIATPEGARAALNASDEAMNRVFAARTQDGALHNRMEHAAQNASNQAINQAAAQSSIEDLDLARAASEMAREKTLGQVSAKAQAMYQAMAQNNLGAVLPGLSA